MDPLLQAGTTESGLGNVPEQCLPLGAAKEVPEVLSLYGFLEETLKIFVFESEGGKERDSFLRNPRNIWECLLQTHFLEECGDIFHLVAGWGCECRKHLGSPVGQTTGAEGRVQRARVRGLGSPGIRGAQGEEG